MSFLKMERGEKLHFALTVNCPKIIFKSNTYIDWYCPHFPLCPLSMELLDDECNFQIFFHIILSTSNQDCTTAFEIKPQFMTLKSCILFNSSYDPT